MTPPPTEGEELDNIQDQNWVLPPTGEYLLSLDEDALTNYCDYLEKDLNDKKSDIHLLFRPDEEYFNACNYVPLIIKLLTYGNYDIPEGNDPYEILYNYLKNAEYQINIKKAYKKFIYTEEDVFATVYNYYMEYRGETYPQFFTDKFLITAMRLWLIKGFNKNIFCSDFIDVINGKCEFVDTGINENFLEFASDLAQKILFCNYKADIDTEY